MRSFGVCVILLCAACATTHAKPAVSQRDQAEAPDAAAPAVMDSERMKSDMTRQQRMEDDQRSRDAFIGRNQRP